jgi:hypothetical protein
MPPVGPLEGWKAIGEFLGLGEAGEALRKRLRGWEQYEGLPIIRHRGRVFAQPLELKDWWARSGRRVPLRALK